MIYPNSYVPEPQDEFLYVCHYKDFKNRHLFVLLREWRCSPVNYPKFELENIDICQNAFPREIVMTFFPSWVKTDFIVADWKNKLFGFLQLNNTVVYTPEIYNLKS